MSETVGRAAVITVARGRQEHLARQQAMLSALRWEVARVVVSMDDPSLAAVTRQHPGVQTITVPVADPGRLPLAAARNAGAEAALEAGAELLVFLDVDCLPGDRLLARYLQAARDDALLCGPVTYLPQGAVLGDCPSGAILDALRAPHAARPDPIPGDVVAGDDVDLFWSLSFAVTSATWRTVGGFHTGYAGYGGEDTDFAWQARQAGCDLLWVGGADAYHQYHPVSRPPVEHLDAILENAAVFHRRWGVWPMRGWLDAFADLGLVRATDGAWERTA